MVQRRMYDYMTSLVGDGQVYQGEWKQKISFMKKS